MNGHGSEQHLQFRLDYDQKSHFLFLCQSFLFDRYTSFKYLLLVDDEVIFT